MIWKLLRKNISIGQILGYAVANFIGLAIVLSALHFYSDVKTAMDGDDSADAIVSKDYLVISSPVSMVANSFSKSTDTFSEADIDDIASQPWAIDVGAFNSADFNVTAMLDLGGRGMSTYLFLESIPDDFLDIRPKGWDFDPDNAADAVIPIILNKDYLALYNFGFATTRGLPQLSEATASVAPVFLRFDGNGRSEVYKARIAGFSSRLNTIAVPEAFLQWANKRFSYKPASDPSRLIVKVKNPGDPAIAEYMQRKGYEVAGDKVDSGRASYFLTLLTSIVVVIGAVICILALFILMLSIFLLLQKNRGKISDLLLLGYSPAQVSAGYYRLIGIVNVAVLVLSVAAMMVAARVWQTRLAQLDIVPSSPIPAVLAGVAIMAVITAVNFLAIRRSVRRCF